MYKTFFAHFYFLSRCCVVVFALVLLNVFAVVRRRRRRRLRRLRRPQLQWRRFVYGALRNVNVDVASSCQRAWCVVALVVVVVVLLHGGPLFLARLHRLEKFVWLPPTATATGPQTGL